MHLDSEQRDIPLYTSFGVHVTGARTRLIQAIESNIDMLRSDRATQPGRLVYPAAHHRDRSPTDKIELRDGAITLFHCWDLTVSTLTGAGKTEKPNQRKGEFCGKIEGSLGRRIATLVQVQTDLKIGAQVTCSSVRTAFTALAIPPVDLLSHLL